MTLRALITRSIQYYWRTNVAVVLGVATAVAVLAGALIVGNSVRASLSELFLGRTGRADFIVSSASFFREDLAVDLVGAPGFVDAFSGAVPIVVLEAVVLHESSQQRAGAVQVYGVDERFWTFHGVDGVSTPVNREALLSPGLARELTAAAGDTLLIRVPNPADVPAGALYGRKDDVGRTIRVTARETLPAGGIGEFSLRPAQGEVRALFVPLARLQRDLQQAGKANAILVSASAAAGSGADRMLAALKHAFALEDVGLRMRAVGQGPAALSVESAAALVTDRTAEIVEKTARPLGLAGRPVFTYLANSIRSAEHQIPYSLVTAIDLDTILPAAEGAARKPVANEAGESSLPPIVLNAWAADDLGAAVGDHIWLDYFVWEEEGRISTRTAEFQLAAVVPISGNAADRDLAPDYPGISGTNDLTDWDPPFPVDLSRIRTKDEDYWDMYRTTPKAFIAFETGRALWQSRYGSRTSVRLYPAAATPAGATASVNDLAPLLARNLKAAIDPVGAGIAMTDVQAMGLEASRGATDFGEYFTYFSFFLVMSALLLTVLFFKLSIEQRLREIGLLRAVGFSLGRVRRLMLMEGVLLASAGAVLGAAGAVAYAWLMLLGLRTWWVDAVGTTALTLHVSPSSLLLGVFGGLIASVGCIAWSLRHLAPASPRSLVTGAFDLSQIEAAGSTFQSGRMRTMRLPGARTVALVSFGAGVAVLAATLAQRIGQTPGFFGGGILLLIGALAALSVWLRRTPATRPSGRGQRHVAGLGLRQASIRPGRSVMCMALVASATFIIVAVEVFRGGHQESGEDRSSGTGGFALMAESLLPLFHDLNSPAGRAEVNLPDEAAGARFFRFRLRPGDDASCLNLYAPRDPRIVAPEAAFVDRGGFSFQGSLATTPGERENPWRLLDRRFDDGAIPVIGDANSTTYVLHLNVGDDFVFGADTARPIKLRLVGTLARSVLQSELVMSESNFLRLFPENDGFRVFLIETSPDRAVALTQALETGLSSVGFDVSSTAERLASYHRVESVLYLSTFQMLGGLGLLLGTIGLATVLLRNVLERRRELALLRAVGYNARHITVMVLSENALLLCGGLIAGTVCALVAIAPAFISRGGQAPALPLGLLAGVLITGFAASIAATAVAVKMPLIPSLRSE